MPPQVLWINSEPSNEFIIWYTPPALKPMLFTASLELPNGQAQVPALVWKATKTSLHLWALASGERPTDPGTALFHAPFFNVGPEGNVCMGNVKLSEDQPFACLEEFMAHWENLFFNSYFSHANHNSMCKINIVTLWKNLLHQPQQPFPVELMIPARTTLKSILS